jgi:CRP-like cAMP-binding protein
MHTEDLGRILDDHPFFKGIDPELRQLLTGCAANERFEAGSYLFREGGKADKFWLVRHGTVAVEVYASGKAPITVETVGEGDVLGWSWLIEPRQYMFDARALTLVRAVSIDAACLFKKMEANHVLGYDVLRRFMPVMAHRIQAARMQMLDLYGPGRKA